MCADYRYMFSSSCCLSVNSFTTADSSTVFSLADLRKLFDLATSVRSLLSSACIANLSAEVDSAATSFSNLNFFAVTFCTSACFCQLAFFSLCYQFFITIHKNSRTFSRTYKNQGLCQGPSKFKDFSRTFQGPSDFKDFSRTV